MAVCYLYDPHMVKQRKWVMDDRLFGGTGSQVPLEQTVFIWRRLCGGVWQPGKVRGKVKGLRSTGWWLQSSHRNTERRIGNAVSNTVITTYGARGMLEISGEHFVKYTLPNHCAVHLKVIQINIKGKLLLKKMMEETWSINLAPLQPAS